MCIDLFKHSTARMVKTLIEEGDNVIFKREDSSRVFQIRRKRMVYFSKLKFNVDELIGQPYGSTFELERGKLTKVQPEEYQNTDNYSGATCAGLDQSADNRNLTDADSNQNLSKEDIMKMKDEGMAGEKIIEELVENSETFKSKTEFSQAKYLKKKKKKHMMVFTVYPPTMRLVMEMYAKEPGKLNFLRPDSFSQLLCFSNVMFGSRVAVMESSQGLVVAGLMERLGGSGKVIQLIPNNSNPPCRQILDYFSFPKEQLNNLYTFPLDQLWTLKSQNLEESFENRSGDQLNSSTVVSNSNGTVEKTESSEIKNTDRDDADANPDTAETKTGMANSSDAQRTDDNNFGGSCSSDLSAEGKDEGMEIDSTKSQTLEGDKPSEEADTEEKAPVFVKNRDLQKVARAKRLKEASEILRERQLDSLVIACKQNPVPVMTRMLDFVGLSRNVVIFSQYIDPLIECYTYIKEKHAGIQLRLWDSWLRAYQVLPQRTHPTVNMSGTGGYLLTFITTEPSS